MHKDLMVYIDDDETLLSIMKNELQNYYDVAAFSDPGKAVQYITQEKDRITLLVTDWNMPGMTGSDVIRESIKQNPHIKTILLTGYYTQISEAEKADCDMIIEKNILKNIDSFIDELNTLNYRSK